MKSIFLMFMTIALISLSCTSKEKIINPVDTAKKIIVATDDNISPKLKVFEVPSMNVIHDDLITGTFGTQISTPVGNIKEFGGNMYIFIPKDFKILIVRKVDLTLITTIDFSADKSEPIDIVFPNATDGYIIHNNSVYISLLDVTNFVVARNITVGNPPHSIDVSENQVLVTNQPDNTISVVDSRDRVEVARIITEPNPSFIKVTPDGKSAICVSVGLGKLNDGASKTPAYFQYVDIANRKITNTYELGFAQILATEQVPQGLVVTHRDWGFIPTNSNFLRVDIRTKDRINLVTRRNFFFISQDTKNEKLLLLRVNGAGTDIMFADDVTGEIGDFYYLPYQLRCVFPF
jgi:YVTN family beta-propeller protein